MLSERDRSIVEHIVEYCDEINEAIAMFDDTLETLKTNSVYKNSVSMCVLQIGELATHFKEKFITANPKIPWANIVRMRHIAVHHYTKFDLDILHKTITVHIPELKEYCLELLK